MKQYWIIPAAISFSAFNFGTTVHAASFDCRQATRLQEIFICQHQKLSRLDEELARAYRAQMTGLSKDGQSAVLASQRSWLAYWPWACSSSSTSLMLRDASTECVSDSYRARLKDLNTLAVSVGHTSYTVSEYRFLAPKNSGGTAATHTISFPQVVINSPQDVSLNVWLARDLNKWRSDIDNDSNTEQLVALTAATTDLVQATETFTFYGHGAAHPQSNMAHHYFLPSEGRALQASDFFTGKRWAAIIADHVFKKLQERLGNNLQIELSQDLYPLITHPSSWSIEKNSFSLEFNPYEVGPYSEGFVDVELPLALIRPHLTPFARDWMASNPK